MNKMNKELLRMQLLSGVITESEYKAKLEESTTDCGCDSKKSLNENFVGIGMVGNIFDREKTDYELAFEHFTKGTSLNEEVEEGQLDMFTLTVPTPKTLGDYTDIWAKFLANYAKNSGEDVSQMSTLQLDTKYRRAVQRKYGLEGNKHADLAQELMDKGLVKVQD